MSRSEESLSLRLREGTRELHGVAEERLGLPWSITERDDYVSCLSRFHSLYRPLERQLRAFADWPDHGIGFTGHSYAAHLASDLARLQPDTSLPPDAPVEACPNLPSFAHALGARYVLEGSTLGGEVILRHLIGASVDGVATACAFLGAGRQRGGGGWHDFRAALDRYGRAQPDAVPHVVTGAERTFRAIGDWLQSSRWRER